MTALQYGLESIPFVVRRSGSRRTLGIEVHPDGSVVVRAPNDCSEDVILERMRRRASWISGQIDDFARYQPRTPQRQYLSGEAHRYLGRQYRLRVGKSKEAAVRLSRGEMLVTLPSPATPERVRFLLERWYRMRASVLFAEILRASMPRFRSVECPRLIVRIMQSRWGSLSAAGRMTLNPRLAQAPRACIEYVIVHELCHALNRAHDKKFYRLLGSLMPDWKRRKERLEQSLL